MADAEYIYADLTYGTPLLPNGSVANFNWVAGQSVKYALRFRQTLTDGSVSDTSLDIKNIRAAVGRVGARPDAGWYRLKVGVGESSGITPKIDISDGPEDVELALNGIAGGSGDYECDQVAGALIVRRRNGENFKISSIADGLRPACYSRITGGQALRRTSAAIEIGPIRYEAVNSGVGGNDISIEYVQRPFQSSLQVSLIGSRIVVNLAISPTLNVASTHQQVAAAVGQAASDIVFISAVPQRDINSLAEPMPRSYLQGGFDGSGFEYAIEFLQAPLAFSDWLGYESAPVPSIRVLQQGETIFPDDEDPDPEKAIKTDTIQELKVPLEFKGTYQFFWPEKGLRTKSLSYLSGIVEIQDYLNSVFAQYNGSVEVENPSNNIAHIKFIDGFSGYNIPPLVVEVLHSPLESSLTFALDLNKAGIFEALREQESVILPFQLEATLKDGRSINLWKTTATIQRSLLWDSLASPPPIDWASRADPVGFTPFSRDQFLIGQQAAYVAVIGNGTSLEYEIVHNLVDSEDKGIVSISVRENVADGKQLRDDQYAIRFTNSRSIKITFNTAPLPNSLAVVIIGYGAKSQFLSHSHTIDQIKTMDGLAVKESLRSILANYGSRLSELESFIPRQPLTLPGQEVSIPKPIVPSIGEVLPDIMMEQTGLQGNKNVSIASQLSTNASPIDGTSIEAQRRLYEAEIAKVKAEAEAATKAAQEAAIKAGEEYKQKIDEEYSKKQQESPTVLSSLILNGVYSIGSDGKTKPVYYPAMRGSKYAPLLSAIHASSAQQTSIVPSVFQSGLYQNSGTVSIVLPGGSGRKSQVVAPGGYFGGDGRAYYSVSRGQGNNSYYPKEMERDLVRAIVKGDQFPKGTALRINWGLDFAFKSDLMSVGAGYTMVVRAAAVAAATSPAPTGENVGSLQQEVVLASARLALSRGVSESRKFSLTLKRTAADTFSEFLNSGIVYNGPAFPDGDLLITVRLEEWDVDDATQIPSGQVSIMMPDTQIIIQNI